MFFSFIYSTSNMGYGTTLTWDNTPKKMYFKTASLTSTPPKNNTKSGKTTLSQIS